MAKTIYKNSYRDHDIVMSRIENGAIIATCNNINWQNILSSYTWFGGFSDIEDAEKEIFQYVDDNIIFEAKRKRAQEAYDLVMRGE
jgi:hypothetical protein